MLKAFASVAFACALVVVDSVTSVRGADDPEFRPGPWHYRAVSCVDTTVTFVSPRLGSEGQTTFPASQYRLTGVHVEFASGLGVQPVFPHATASVTHYQGDTGNDVMTAEHKGDRVQLCFLGGPAPTTSCDPDADSRGRTYRVYDYRQRAQYAGTNSEHGCGGA